MGKLKHLAALAAAGVIAAASAVTAFAGVTYSMSASPSKTKTISWRMDGGGEAEYRYKEGADDEGGFYSAYSLGTASNASVEVDGNGEYTMYARTADGDIMYSVIPVTSIDDAAPVIKLLDIEKNPDGTYNVTYSATDAFDVADTRMIGGSVGTDYFDAAAPIGGGVLKNLSPGEYTIFAKDTAGNISIHPFSLDGSEWSTEWSESTSTEWATEWSTEYYGANIQLHFKSVETGAAQLSKQYATTGSELPGAKMTLKDTEIGEVIDEWTSGTSPHIVKGLTPGRTYTLIEVTAPDGYEKAESVEFVLKDDGTVTKVTMYDAPVQRPSGGGPSGGPGGGPDHSGETVELCKKDVTTGDELPGAHMELWDKDRGTVIESWTSGTTPHYVRGLSKGVTYTLVEITAPDGYEKAESIDFTIRDSGSVTRVIMYDAPVNAPTAPVPTTAASVAGAAREEPVLPQTGGYMNFTSLLLIIGAVCLCVGIYASAWCIKHRK